MAQTITFTTQQLLALAQSITASDPRKRLNISPQSEQLAAAESSINLSFARNQITYPQPPQLAEPQRINTLRIDGKTYTDRIEWTRAWTRIYNDNFSSLATRPQGAQPVTIENIVNSQGVALQRLVAAQPLPSGTAATTVSQPTAVGTQLLQGTYIGAQGPAGVSGVPGAGVRAAALVDGVLTFTLSDNTVIQTTGSVVGSPGAQGPQGPQGPQGIQGAVGPAPNISIGTVTTTALPEVTVTGSNPNYVLNFGLKQGDPGPTGPAANFSIGTVTAGASPAVTISGSAPNYTLDFTLQAGPAGPGSGDVSTLGLYANPSWITSLAASKVGLGNVTNESKATMFTNPTFTGTVSGVSAAMVGLGNVTNESKATMFTNPTFTGIPAAPTAATSTDTTQIATTAFVQSQKISPVFSGTPTAPTAAAGTNTTQIATTAFVTTAVAGVSLPAGIILMWSGLVATIPAGFVLCDGNNGTPDLRDKFIVGARQDFEGESRTFVTNALTKSGGNKNAVLVSHTHTATVSENNHTHTYTLPVWRGANGGNTNPAWGGGDRQDASNIVSTSSGAKTNLTVELSTEGTSGVNANLPPYYALAFIMKT